LIVLNSAQNTSYYRKRWHGQGSLTMRKKMSEVVNWYLPRMGIFGLSASNQRLKNLVGQLIIREMGNKYLSAAPLKGVPRLTREDVKRFRSKLLSEGKKESTVLKYIVIGGTMIMAVNRTMDWNMPNPFSAEGKGLSERPREREITQDEQTAIMFGMPGKYRDILNIILDTGMRIGEVINLTWDRVDLVNQWITLESKDNKSRRFRKVALSVRAADIISKQEKSSGKVFNVRYDTFRQAFHRARIKAGVAHCTPHDFRRTFGYRRRRAGVDLDALQAQFGHKSRETTERIYAKVDESKARQAVLSCGQAL
jgi:integrase